MKRVGATYSPNSVLKAIRYEEFGSDWTEKHLSLTEMVYAGIREAARAVGIGHQCISPEFPEHVTMFPSPVEKPEAV